MSENKPKLTYNFEEINNKIKEFSNNLETKYSFIKIEEPKTFKHFIDKESYHYTIKFSISMDEKFLKDKFNASQIDFPLEFDLDVATTTTQYADYILADIFEKFDMVCSNIEEEYSNFKETPFTKASKQNYSV